MKFIYRRSKERKREEKPLPVGVPRRLIQVEIRGQLRVPRVTLLPKGMCHRADRDLPL